MGTMSRFQIIFTAALIFIGLAGVVVFAVSKSSGGGQNSAVQVTMWGTLPEDKMNDFIGKVNFSYSNEINVNYVEKSEQNFEIELVSALARGKGPDMVLLPQNLIVPQFDKFFVIPYETYSQRAFIDSFIQEGELFMTPSGIVGIPFTVDPIVMYWNRAIFTDAGSAKPPVSWVEFFTLAPKMTKKDANGNIVQSTIAMGEIRNIVHGPEMLSLLSMQAGTPIVKFENDKFISLLEGRPAEEALSYFTEWSNPVKESYSWNRSLPNDRNMFISGRLAVYFGNASELAGIRAANPNLDFDIALVPQAEGRRMTFGKMSAIALLKSSQNIGAAFNAATKLTSAPYQTAWQEVSGLPPVRRDQLVSLPTDAYKSIIHQSSLISTGWLEPGPLSASSLFMRMVDNVSSGRMRISQSVEQADGELNNLLTNANY
jgi:multiple sugar transport system substrate-binding protein